MTAPENLPRKPRVLHFVTHLALGGAERVALDLIRGLRGEFDFAVYAVHGIADEAVGRAMAAELAEAHVPLFTGTRVPMKIGGILLAGLGAAAAVRRFQPDLIHVHTEIPEAAYATMVTLHRNLAGIPLVRTIHNSVYWHHWPRLGRWCERRMPRPNIAAVSNDALRAFVQHRTASGSGKLAAPPVVIFNGVSEPLRIGNRPQVSRDLLRVLFAGRLDEQKGADLLPEILRACQFPGNLPGELTIYGEGRLGARLSAFAINPPPGWTVRVNPPIENLPSRMHEFDLVIVPSRFEGLGLIAIEAMLAGVPVVGTDAPGLREALPQGHPWIAAAGNAAAFAQALQLAVAERSVWPEAAARARAFARQSFAPEKMRTAYARFYRQSLAAKKIHA